MLLNINKTTNLGLVEFINLLYQHKKLIETLWANRPNPLQRAEILAKEEIMEFQLDKLINQNMLSDNEGNITLNEIIVSFFEDFLQKGNEISIGSIHDIIKEIVKNIEIYKTDNREKYITTIKRRFQKLTLEISLAIINLQKLIEDTYKNETHFETKKKRLLNYEHDRISVEEIISATDQLFEKQEDFFSMMLVVDRELNSIVTALKHSLLQNRNYLFEIQTQVRDYINKILYQSDVYKKIQKLKELKDNYGSLRHTTNIEKVATNSDSIALKERMRLRPRVSLDFIFEPEGIEITNRVRERIKIERGIKQKHREKSAILESNFDEKMHEESVKINTHSFVKKFVKSGVDLFSFILNYEFPNGLFQNVEKRITLFVEISMDYEKELHFTNDLVYHTFTDSENIRRKVGCALVLPLNE